MSKGLLVWAAPFQLTLRRASPFAKLDLRLESSTEDWSTSLLFFLVTSNELRPAAWEIDPELEVGNLPVRNPTNG